MPLIPPPFFSLRFSIDYRQFYPFIQEDIIIVNILRKLPKIRNLAIIKNSGILGHQVRNPPAIGWSRCGHDHGIAVVDSKTHVIPTEELDRVVDFGKRLKYKSFARKRIPNLPDPTLLRKGDHSQQSTKRYLYALAPKLLFYESKA